MEPPPRKHSHEQPSEREEHAPLPLLAGEDEEEAVLDPHIHRGID
ncbi:hypothetical protein ABT288_17735 [Streptomyces sp. NPDC001093]